MLSSGHSGKWDLWLLIAQLSDVPSKIPFFSGWETILSFNYHRFSFLPHHKFLSYRALFSSRAENKTFSVISVTFFPRCGVELCSTSHFAHFSPAEFSGVLRLTTMKSYSRNVCETVQRTTPSSWARTLLCSKSDKNATHTASTGGVAAAAAGVRTHHSGISWKFRLLICLRPRVNISPTLRRFRSTLCDWGSPWLPRRLITKENFFDFCVPSVFTSSFVPNSSLLCSLLIAPTRADYEGWKRKFSGFSITEQCQSSSTSPFAWKFHEFSLQLQAWIFYFNSSVFSSLLGRVSNTTQEK